MIGVYLKKIYSWIDPIASEEANKPVSVVDFSDVFLVKKSGLSKEFMFYKLRNKYNYKFSTEVAYSFFRFTKLYYKSSRSLGIPFFSRIIRLSGQGNFKNLKLYLDPSLYYFPKIKLHFCAYMRVREPMPFMPAYLNIYRPHTLRNFKLEYLLNELTVEYVHFKSLMERNGKFQSENIMYLYKMHILNHFNNYREEGEAYNKFILKDIFLNINSLELILEQKMRLKITKIKKKFNLKKKRYYCRFFVLHFNLLNLVKVSSWFQSLNLVLCNKIFLYYNRYKRVYTYNNKKSVTFIKKKFIPMFIKLKILKKLRMISFIRLGSTLNVDYKLLTSRIYNWFSKLDKKELRTNMISKFIRKSIDFSKYIRRPKNNRAKAEYRKRLYAKFLKYSSLKEKERLRKYLSGYLRGYYLFDYLKLVARYYFKGKGAILKGKTFKQSLLKLKFFLNLKIIRKRLPFKKFLIKNKRKKKFINIKKRRKQIKYEIKNFIYNYNKRYWALADTYWTRNRIFILNLKMMYFYRLLKDMQTIFSSSLEEEENELTNFERKRSSQNYKTKYQVRRWDQLLNKYNESSGGISRYKELNRIEDVTQSYMPRFLGEEDFILKTICLIFFSFCECFLINFKLKRKFIGGNYFLIWIIIFFKKILTIYMFSKMHKQLSIVFNILKNVRSFEINDQYFNIFSLKIYWNTIFLINNRSNILECNKIWPSNLPSSKFILYFAESIKLKKKFYNINLTFYNLKKLVSRYRFKFNLATVGKSSIKFVGYRAIFPTYLKYFNNSYFSGVGNLKYFNLKIYNSSCVYCNSLFYVGLKNFTKDVTHLHNPQPFYYGYYTLIYRSGLILK